MKHSTAFAGAALAAAASLFLHAPPARADFTHWQCLVGAHSGVRALRDEPTTDARCWGFVAGVDGDGAQTVLFDEPVSGDLVASSDGRVVVALSTYIADGDIDPSTANPVAVRVYRDGALVKTLRLREVATPRSLRQSTSHLTWASRLPDAVYGNSLVVILNDGTAATIDLR